MALFKRKPAPVTSTGDELPSRLLLVRRKGSRTAFRINETGALVLLKEAPSEYASALIYDQDERRIAVDKPITYHAAFRKLRQEYGIAASIVNSSKTARAIYGLEEASASLLSGQAVPLLAAVDEVLHQDQITLGARPMLVVVHFANPGQTGCALLVLGVNADRSVVTSDLAINPTEARTVMSNALRAMVVAGHMQGLPWDPRQSAMSPEVKEAQDRFYSENVVPISSLRLLEVMQPRLAYPLEPMYRGLRQSSIIKFSAAVAGAAALGLGVGAFALDRLAKQVIADTEARVTEVMERKIAARTSIVKHAGGLTQKLTLKPEQLFDAADRIYRMGSKVQVDATLEKASLTLVVPVTRSQLAPGADRRMVVLSRDAEQILDGLRAKAPDANWQISGMEVSGDLNAWFVSFTSRPLDADLLALVGLSGAGGAQQVAPVPVSPAGAAKPVSAASIRR